MSLEEQRRNRVHALAWELQHRKEAQEEQARVADGMRDAAQELGLDPTFLVKAEEEVRQLEVREAREARDRRRQRMIAGGVAVGAVVAVGIGYEAWKLAFPPPPPPWEEPFENAAGWALDKSPGTAAEVRWQHEAGRGQVAVIDVERFAPKADGTFHANFDGFGIPADLSGYTELGLDVKGTLPTARVYLEAGDERWRSPPLNVTADWAPHEIPLRAFERQVRDGGKWKDVGYHAPDGLTQVSIKVGHFMNEADATGTVTVDDLRLE